MKFFAPGVTLGTVKASGYLAEGKGAMVVAIRGATVLSEWEGIYTCGAIYKRRSEACGYVPPTRPICVSLPLGGTEAYGTYHKESFVCPFCESRQVVQLRG